MKIVVCVCHIFPFFWLSCSFTLALAWMNESFNNHVVVNVIIFDANTQIILHTATAWNVWPKQRILQFYCCVSHIFISKFSKYYISFHLFALTNECKSSGIDGVSNQRTQRIFHNPHMNMSNHKLYTYVTRRQRVYSGDFSFVIWYTNNL